MISQGEQIKLSIGDFYKSHGIDLGMEGPESRTAHVAASRFY
jgi:hypothetical protein